MAEALATQLFGNIVSAKDPSARWLVVGLARSDMARAVLRHSPAHFSRLHCLTPAVAWNRRLAQYDDSMFPALL